MRLFERAPDGGANSGVTGFFVIEIKSLFSIVLLRFRDGSREAFHSHAFNALTWILKGKFIELQLNGTRKEFAPSLQPKLTLRSCFHKVISQGTTWALTLRGPWVNTWKESKNGEIVTMTHGRVVVGDAQ